MESKRRKSTAVLPEFALPEEELRHQLVSDSNRTVLEAYLGAAHYRELRALALQAAQNRVRTGPRVYVLPGIMGSKLGTLKLNQSSKPSPDDLLWINPEEIGRGRLIQLALPRGKRFQALDVVVPIYLKLKLKLEIAGFDVRFHAYDWRQSIETLGRELMERVQRDPVPTVLLVAHSMGGLVGRVALKLDSERKIGRLVMIGTPNFGSFAPVLALRGVYPAVRKVTTLDLEHSAEVLAGGVFNTFPGLHHLLPTRECFDKFDLYDLKNWPGSSPEACSEKNSMGPRRSILKDIARVRESLAAPDDRFVSIVGTNQETVTGLSRDRHAFEYSSTFDGDGTVPVASAALSGVPTYYIEEGHPALPTNTAVGAAAIDLLQQGTTSLLPQTWRCKQDATRTVDEEELRLQDTQKRVWSTMTLEERRALLQGLALPVSNLPNATS